ncbi:MAG: hypothetical protein CVV44_19495 [Spirochaetae bacterium HGW-Spirochaetae-1]|jgi:PAS domain S-box-containing protein|nr:MAG: hypothetical protein CVV44_19495 [Spirochaetae bacterium HGW-Spirochaetae-1]
MKMKTALTLPAIVLLLGIAITPARVMASTIELTGEEKQWLHEHDGKIILAPETNYPPLHFLDESGSFTGMAEDYLIILEKRLGFHFKKVTVHEWASMLSMAKNREIDVIMTIVNTPERREYFNFTTPFFHSSTMIIVRQDDQSINSMEDLPGKKVTATKGYQVINYASEHFPKLDIIQVPDEQTSLKMVSEGKARAALVQLDVASYYIEKLNIKNLRVAGETGHTYDFSIGSRNDWPILNRILEKGLASITPDEREEIYRKWIHLEQASSHMERNRLRSLVILLSAGIAMILAIILFLKFLKKSMHVARRNDGPASIVSIRQLLSGKYLYLTVPLIASMFILAFLILAGFYYYMTADSPEIKLTDEEQQWLMNNNNKTTLAVNPVWAPIEFIDENGVYTGYTADIINKIEKKLQFSFKIVPMSSWDNTIISAKTGKVDVIGLISQTPDRSLYLSFTKPYLTVQNVILVRKNLKNNLTLADLRNFKTALVRGTALEGYIKSRFPGVPINLVNNETEGLRKLSFGEVDAMVTSLPAASWIIEREGLINFRIAGDAEFSYSLSIASRKDIPILHNILEKAMNHITTNEQQQLKKKWLGLNYDIESDHNFFIMLMVSTGIFIFIIILILQWNRSLKKLVNIRSQELARELAERTKAQQEAMQQSDFNKIFIQASPLFYVALDGNGRILMMNDAALRALGYNLDEVMGGDFISLFVTEEDRDAAQEVQCGLSSCPSESTRQFDIISRSGRILTVEWYSCSLFRRDGSFDFLFSMGTDITERKRTEEIMLQTEKMMTVAGLAAGMAHEINNPLGIIMLAAESVKRRFDINNAQNLKTAESLHLDLPQMHGYLEKREIYKYLESIQNAGSRAAKIVSNMLQFSRTAGTEKTSTDINKLINDSIELVSSDYDMKKNYDFKHIIIKREYDMALSRVLCIRNEIEQVIFNILKNAAHALNEKRDEEFEPRITIRTMEQANRAVIHLSDNGPGMEETVRYRIFEPFYTTKPVGDGTGLGLSVSYFIITQNHHGSISASSQPGEGTTFTITLPFS